MKHGLTGEQIDGMPGLSKAEKQLLKSTDTLTLDALPQAVFLPGAQGGAGGDGIWLAGPGDVVPCVLH